MELSYIYTDNKYNELGYLKDAYLDIDIGKYGKANNDFEIKLGINKREPSFDVGSLFYSVGTEYGGIVENIKVTTKSNEITLKGSTFRGMLEKEYVQPLENTAYLELEGEANTCINELITGRFDGLFVADNIGQSGINVDYSIRDLNLLDALEKMLEKSNAKLEIKILADGKAHLQAKPIQDLSEIIQYDNDYQVYMTVETQPKPYNHILALGKGELTERLRVNLYLQENGEWTKTEFYTGIERKTYKYENVNIDVEETLIEEAIKAVKDKTATDTLNIDFNADDCELFDVVGAKEQTTGVSFKAQITQKILKGVVGKESISYQIGETGTKTGGNSQAEVSGGGGSSGGGGGNVSINLNGTEEIGEVLSLMSMLYPVGSVYVTSTNANPASYLGGTWELFDKEFTYLGTNSLANFVTLNTTNCTSVSGSIVRTGHQLFFKVGINPAVAITDTTTEMFTFNLADIGVSSLTVDISPSFFSDGGQACVSANITTAGVFRTTDVFVRNTTNNSLAAGTSVGQALINYNIYWKHMLDSACNKFHWKRTA